MDRENGNEKVQGDANGKGKGKETSLSLPPRPNTESALTELAPDCDSLVSRLTLSATQLARDFTNSRAAAVDIAELLPSGKAGISAATPSKNYRATTDTPISQSNGAAAASGGSFRSSRAPEKNTSREPGFSTFLDHTGRLEPAENDIGSSQRLDPQEPQLHHHRQISAEAANMMEDGLEVVGLLDSDYVELVDKDLQMTLLVGEQATLRRALFQDDGQWKRKPVGDCHEDNLNFFPDFLLNSAGTGRDMSDHLGITDPDNARVVWVRHWKDVLSSYTDEVWGNLSPLVGKAHEELRALSESPGDISSSEAGALRRLQQILAHVRGV